MTVFDFGKRFAEMMGDFEAECMVSRILMNQVEFLEMIRRGREVKTVPLPTGSIDIVSTPIMPRGTIALSDKDGKVLQVRSLEERLVNCDDEH